MKLRIYCVVVGFLSSVLSMAAQTSSSSLAGTASAPTTASVTKQGISPAAADVTTTGGKAGYLPVFNGASTIIDSKVKQSSAGIAITGDLTTTGAISGSGFQIGSDLFDSGFFTNQDAYLGFAQGSGSVIDVIAIGFAALDGNTGNYNVAVGAGALEGAPGIANSGIDNAAVGQAALNGNTTGSENTAVGAAAGTTGDNSAITGSYNTSLGRGAIVSTGSLSNATAIGAQSEVSEGNALVLGCTPGENSCPGAVNVGIGTTAPRSLLTVTGSDTTANGFGAALQISNTASGGGNWYLRSGATGNNTPAGGLSIANDDQYAVEIEADGYVGILTNTTNPPDMPLSVNGGADKPGGGSWATFSDRRLKNLDGSFRSGLGQIMKLSPVLYRYKADNAMGIRDRDEHVGLVAQDVQKVVPEAVTENSKGYLLLNNDPIIWAMLNAIKEQQREIRALKSELRATRETLQKVEVKVATSQLTVVAKK
jgi:hypothetical protein